MLFHVFSCNFIKIDYFLYCFNVFLSLISSFLRIMDLLLLYRYVSLQSIDCIVLSLLAINAILITSSVNTLCFLLQNLSCNFNINLLSFKKFCDFLLHYILQYFNIIFFLVVYFIFESICFLTIFKIFDFKLSFYYTIFCAFLFSFPSSI